MEDVERLVALSVEAWLGQPVAVRPLPAAASSRRYYRMAYGPGAPYSSLIGAAGMSAAENRAFVAIARCLEAEAIAAPRVLAVEHGDGAYIVTDLGDRCLMDVVADAARKGWDDTPGLEALMRCVDSLPAMQYGVAARLDPAVCYPRGRMDRRSMMWDLNHFKYCFLKAAGAEIDEEGLEDDFMRLVAMIETQADGPFWAFIHRDCQSRNVMLTAPGDIPAWIDFQGGRFGPVAYDVASLVWHGRAAIPPGLRSMLLDRYVAALGRVTGRHVDRSEFEEALMPVLVLRLLQVLGAYGLRGITEGKAAFITPMPAVAGELGRLVPWIESHGMEALASAVAGLGALRPVREAAERRGALVVTVMSFSYKRGLPRDYSGNGGGFVFDCRYPDNPGRYEPYRHLTGRDPEVIQFLEESGEMPLLAGRAADMVIPAVERYRSRGFTHLSVAFGCTGGQHRSVYGADYMARQLREMGVAVRLIHREQGIDEYYP